MIYLATALVLLWILWQRPKGPQLAGVPDAFLHNEPEPDKPWQRLLMFKKDGGDAPSPDPRIGKAALKNAELGESWLDFAREQFEVSSERQEKTDALSNQLTEQQIGIANRKTQWAQEDRQRYEDTFVPLEDEFVNRVQEFATPEKQDEAAAEARATVLSAADQNRQARAHRMQAMGIDPTSGRYQGIQREAATDTALAAADAENRSRVRVRQKGLGLLADTANFGRGLPAQSAGAAQIGVGAGNSAFGINQGANAQFRSNIGIMGQGYSGAMKGYQSQAGILNNLYQNQLAGWSAQQQASATAQSGAMSGIGSLVGTAAGLFMMSSKDFKENKRNEDGALEAVTRMPVQRWKYKDGIADSGEHIGPYAEDFQRETGVGDGKTIDIVSAIGLGLKATQELSDKVSKLEAKGKKKTRKQAAMEH